MAIETHTHLLVVTYDEEKESVPETFGVTHEEVREVFNQFVNSVDHPMSDDDTFTSQMMSLVNSGKISGGMLLTLATHDIMSAVSQKKAQITLGKMLKGILKDPDMRFALGIDEDKPDEE